MSKSKIIGLILIIVVIAAAGAGYYFKNKDSGKSNSSTTNVQTTPEPKPASGTLRARDFVLSYPTNWTPGATSKESTNSGNAGGKQEQETIVDYELLPPGAKADNPNTFLRISDISSSAKLNAKDYYGFGGFDALSTPSQEKQTTITGYDAYTLTETSSYNTVKDVIISDKDGHIAQFRFTVKNSSNAGAVVDEKIAMEIINSIKFTAKLP